MNKIKLKATCILLLRLLTKDLNTIFLVLESGWPSLSKIKTLRPSGDVARDKAT